jgi:hypothetical protein
MVGLDGDVVVGGCDGDDIGLERRPVQGRHHGQARGVGQQVHQQAAMLRRKVLGHHVAHLPAGDEVGQQLLECLETTGGSADTHHMVEGSAHHEPRVRFQDFRVLASLRGGGSLRGHSGGPA